MLLKRKIGKSRLYDLLHRTLVLTSAGFCLGSVAWMTGAALYSAIFKKPIPAVDTQSSIQNSPSAADGEMQTNDELLSN